VHCIHGFFFGFIASIAEEFPERRLLVKQVRQAGLAHIKTKWDSELFGKIISCAPQVLSIHVWCRIAPTEHCAFLSHLFYKQIAPMGNVIKLRIDIKKTGL